MKLIKSFKADKKFYSTLLLIAIPVIIQHLVSIGLNLVDTIMIGRLGELELAAVGIANRVYFIFAISCFGFYSGANIFISQFWGVRDVKNIRKIFGIEITVGLIISTFFTLLVLIFPRQVMSIFINNEKVINYGVDYLKIVGFSYIFISMSFAVSFNSRSVHLLKIPTIVNIIALTLNTILNYLLIYGKLGFPSLGVKGAAIATLIARSLEIFLLIYLVYKGGTHPLAGKLSELFDFDKVLIKKVIKTSLPVFINESFWVIGTSIYYIAYGMIGANALAVVQVTFTLSDFFQSLFFGMGSASAVMLGNELGKNNKELAYEYSLRFIKITAVISVIISIIFYFLRNAIIGFYNFSEVTNSMLNLSLIVSAIYTTPKMVTYLIIVGILRSGGDTKFCMYTDILFVWLLGIPLAFISVLVFKWPIYLVLAAVFTEEVVKFNVVFLRVKSKKWLNNLVS